MLVYFIVYKPFGVLTQFSAESGKKTLADFFKVPKDVYPVGRLDIDSEGLLLLTNDSLLNKRLLHPKNAHKRTYWVQVEGAITETAINSLSQGIHIKTNGKNHITRPAQVIKFKDPPAVAERYPPIRFRKNIPTSWISIQLTEGKNRQVRKMTAATGFPTLRLIRYSIEKITLDPLQPGDIQEWKQSMIYQALFSN